MRDSRNWNIWLAGLIEGDGCIVVPRERKGEKKKKYPHIELSSHVKNKELIQKIIETTGSGVCYKDSNSNTVRLRWQKKADLLNIIERINGHFRTPKIGQLHKLIDWYNEEGKLETKIEKKGLDNTPISENAWLSGMSDADSNFSIILTNRKNSYRVQRQWRLEIAQKTHYGGEQQSWVEHVSAYLGSNLLSRHRYVDLTKKEGTTENWYSSWIIVAHNQESLKKVEEYFERYPLYSSKYLDFKDWVACGLIKEKSKGNYEKIKEIKSGMNSQRKKWNWDHINK